jgi:hypothetical protein
VKQTLQKEGVIKKGVQKGGHRKRRERAPIPGMLLHQDGSTHEWVSGQLWDLIVTMDDATSEHYSMFFVEEEGTQSSFRGMKETIEKKGLGCSLYTDRGSHYWWTPKEGGPVDKGQYTQFRRGMQKLGIEMIAAYSPEARGRSERAFGTHQGRLPKELALMGITTMDAANRYLRETYMPRFNEEFCVPALEEGSAFVPLGEVDLNEILCEQHERKVGRDNCVHFEGRVLQIPSNPYRCHYVGATVRVSLYGDGRVALFHGPRKLVEYDEKGEAVFHWEKAA